MSRLKVGSAGFAGPLAPDAAVTRRMRRNARMIIEAIESRLLLQRNDRLRERKPVTGHDALCAALLRRSWRSAAKYRAGEPWFDIECAKSSEGYTERGRVSVA